MAMYDWLDAPVGNDTTQKQIRRTQTLKRSQLTDVDSNKRCDFIANRNGRYEYNDGEFGNIGHSMGQCVEDFLDGEPKEKECVKEYWDERCNT